MPFFDARPPLPEARETGKNTNCWAEVPHSGELCTKKFCNFTCLCLRSGFLRVSAGTAVELRSRCKNMSGRTLSRGSHSRGEKNMSEPAPVCVFSLIMLRPRGQNVLSVYTRSDFTHTRIMGMLGWIYCVWKGIYVWLLYICFRHVRNTHNSTSGVGQSISVQPLLPIGENAIGKFVYAILDQNCNKLSA